MYPLLYVEVRARWKAFNPKNSLAKVLLDLVFVKCTEKALVPITLAKLIDASLPPEKLAINTIFVEIQARVANETEGLRFAKYHLTYLINLFNAFLYHCTWILYNIPVSKNTFCISDVSSDIDTRLCIERNNKCGQFYSLECQGRFTFWFWKTPPPHRAKDWIPLKISQQFLNTVKRKF